MNVYVSRLMFVSLHVRVSMVMDVHLEVDVSKLWYVGEVIVMLYMS